MDTAHWPQGIGIGVVNKSMEDSSSARPVLERKARPQKDQALNCPRCNSTTTKFCYYNNYSLSQPRYFCKTCRRYWTEGGSLRNVPVGGGSRKNNKRSNSSSPSTSSAKKLHQDHNQGQISNFPVSDQNPKIHYQGQDLNLAYPPSEQDYENIHIDQNKSHVHQNPSSSSSHHLHHFSAMELLKNGMVASRGLNSFVPMSVVPDHSNNNLTMFSAGFPMQEFKPTHGLSFSLDGFESGGFGCLQIQGVQESLKHQIIPSSTIPTTSAAATTEFDQNNRGGGEGDNISGGGGGGYWNGMLGGGSW